ncbi:MAG: 2TM domain-containing protein [Betaproteobacteria bacterium]
MTELRDPLADPVHQEAVRRAHKRVREIRGFYVSASSFAIIIPCLWIFNLSGGGKLWAHWATIGWGIGLTVHGLSVFAGKSFFGVEWEEKKVDEIMARENLKVVSREKQLMQAQLRMLQAQIEPHFLFNTLANIQSLIARSPDKASLMMDNFIAYLRESLSASRAQEGTVQQEFTLIRHYLDLIKIRMAHRINYTLNLPPELAAMPMAPMLLQPIVENAIKHGLEPKIEGGSINVVAKIEGGQMLVTVEDDGLGFSEFADSKGTGVGLANLRERLAVLYDGGATIDIADANPGTRICLSLPLPYKVK